MNEYSSFISSKSTMNISTIKCLIYSRKSTNEYSSNSNSCCGASCPSNSCWTPVTPAIATAGNQAAQPVIKFGTWTALYGNTQNPNNVNPLTSTLAQQFQNKTLLDTYNAQINLPSKQAVQNQVYDQYGFRDKLDDIKAQQYALAKQITSPMTEYFF